jgi:molybdate transport repressor ModE-like protein
MTLHQLKIVAAVARHGSITNAARELHISQPSVFQQVKSLEQSCGVKLYVKSGKGIELTPEGKKFEAEVREILQRIERLEEKYRSTRGAKREILSVGGSHAPSVSILPSLLGAFKKHHPDLQVSLQTRSSRAIELLVINGKIDLAVITHPSSDVVGYQHEPFRNEKVVIFASTDHRLAKKRRWNLQDIARLPLIIHKATSGRTGVATLDLLQHIEALGVTPNVMMECNSAEAVKSAVMERMGVGVLMAAHLSQEVRRGALKIVNVKDLETLANQSMLIYQQEEKLSPRAREFLAILRSAATPAEAAHTPAPSELPQLSVA